jgi:hypothetical protein
MTRRRLLSDEPQEPSRSARALPLACLLALVLALLAASPVHAAPPSMSRAEIMARAESGLGTSYTWGAESWVPNAGGQGPDCSGYLLKCWEVPRTLLYQEETPANASISPRYTTAEFYNNSGPWYTLSSRSSLLEADALVRRDSTSGHVVLFSHWDAYGYPVIYEAPGSGLLVRKVARYLGSDYVPKRRSYLGVSSILLDNPTAKSTGGSDLGGNWTRSTSVTGYYGDDYQVQLGGSVTAWARWTPRLNSSGNYDVYIRWTSSWNRASNARVTINTPAGQLVRYVDQKANGGQWYHLGRYYLKAGYSTGSGSTAIHATGADGYVVADSALFVPAK